MLPTVDSEILPVAFPLLNMLASATALAILFPYVHRARIVQSNDNIGWFVACDGPCEHPECQT